MDETTRTARIDRDPGGEPPAGTPAGTDAASRADPQAEQARLPFEQLPPVALPFDDEVDRPIGFALTARARRAVAPSSVPPLAIIDDEPEEDPADTRPSRARALRRAGVALEDIARQLRVDELLVRAWAGDVVSRGRRRSTSPGARAAAVLAAPAAASEQVAPNDGDARLAGTRRRAVLDARQRLGTDPTFAAGVGLLAGMVHLDRHAVGFETDRPELAARALAWIRDQAGADPRDVRVVLRLGSGVAGDLARHRWASQLGLDAERIAFTRSRSASRPDAVDALVRLTDPEVAARVAGWCEALLEPEIDPADVAF